MKKSTLFAASIMSLMFMFPFGSLATSQEVSQDSVDKKRIARDLQKAERAEKNKNAMQDFSEVNLDPKNLPEALDHVMPPVTNDNSFSPLSSNYSVPLVNGDFESGYAGWYEFIYENGGWYDYENMIVDMWGDGYGSWSAYLSENGELLISTPFRLSVNTQDLSPWYNANFWHSGNCSYGENGVVVYIVDEQTGSVVSSVYHNAETTEPDYEWKQYYTIFDNVESVIGKDLTFRYYVYNEDPNCFLSLDVDNIDLVGGKSDACTGTNCNVYRFWSNNKQGHFYTMSEAEANYVINNYPRNEWQYEMASWSSFSAQEAGTIPIYRFWSDEKQHHFYTASEEEKQYVIDFYPDNVWRYEQIAYYAYPSAQPGTKAIYRFWSDQKQGHFYTSSLDEKNYVDSFYPDNVWRYEQIAWYVPE